MGILRALGVGSQKIAAQGNRTVGVVTSAETCWMIKVNGTRYTGGRFLDAFTRCPDVGETIQVYVDGGDPAKYAVIV